MNETFEEAYKCGAHAVWLSGSGPTIVAMCEKDNGEFVGKMNMYFMKNNHKWKCCSLNIDNVGAVVKERK